MNQTAETGPDVTNLTVQHPCSVLKHYARLQSLRKKIPYLTLLNKLGSRKSRSDGAGEAGIAKYFLVSLEILGKRESCNFHHASGSIHKDSTIYDL